MKYLALPILIFLCLSVLQTSSQPKILNTDHHVNNGENGNNKPPDLPQKDNISEKENFPQQNSSIEKPADIIKDTTWGFLSSYEFTLCLSILGFGLGVILIEFYLIKTNKINQENTLKFIIITIIIISTLFLISAGYNNNQIAPATGLLGTIAGYLLGKTNLEKKDE